MLPKWTHDAFSYILDTARVNAGTIFNVKNEATLDSFELGWYLAESLVLPLVLWRSKNGLSRKTMLKMSIMLPNEPVQDDNEQRLPQSKKRCSQCVKELVGTPGYKSKKDAQSKMRIMCSRCRQPTCRKHLVGLCPDCAK